ncbi:YhcB family protein [Pseudomonas sp.]|uniref:YhcB family protein n=1 Tax=Pseudomonas sp. TaxID=306 RepID=UPI004053BA57
MEQTLTAWLLHAITLVAGIAIGFLIARLAPNAAPSRTQRQLDEMQERFDTYQSEVVSHFNTTASMVKKLTQSYQDVQEHLSDGANRLALDELTRQRLLAALHTEDASEKRERLTPPKNNEMPKDYAPKSADVPGMLDASYGLKNK